MASRIGPVIAQLAILYFVISFIVRLVRKAGKASTGTGTSPGRASAAPPDSSGVPQLTPAGGLRREERLVNGVL